MNDILIVPLTNSKQIVLISSIDGDIIMGLEWYRNTDGATIWKRYKSYHLGYFSDERTAALIYNIHARKLYRRHANLNELKWVK